MTGFHSKLNKATNKNNSLLCIGLDPDPNLLPIKDIALFNREIIDATKDLVCCYKPNLAFYESLGMDGLLALEIGHNQYKRVSDILKSNGYREIGKEHDINRNIRCIMSTKVKFF